MKILMLIPVWKRPEIFRLFMWRFEAVKPDYAEVEPLFILSPEDPHLKILERLTSGYNCFYYSNEYLSDKLNAGMTYALNFDFDFLMGMGSDNVYTSLLWELYRDYFLTERYFALDDFYVYDTVNERAWFMKKYVDEPTLGGIGAGRVMHRSLIEDEPAIYRTKTNQGMDGFSAAFLARKGHIQKIVQTDDRPVLLDIKCNTNVNHSIELYPQRERDVSVDWIKQEFGLMDPQILDDGTFSMLSFDGFHSEVLKQSQYIRKEDAFNSVNTSYEMAFGVKKYKNIESYYSSVSQRMKK